MITQKKIKIPIFNYKLTIIIYDNWSEVSHYGSLLDILHRLIMMKWMFIFLHTYMKKQQMFIINMTVLKSYQMILTFNFITLLELKL